MKRFLICLIVICLFFTVTGCDFSRQTNNDEYAKIISDFENSTEELPRYYSSLTKTEKVTYIRVVEAINNASDIAYVPDINTDSLHSVTTAVSYDNPQFFWLSKTWTITHNILDSTIEIPYLISKEERAYMTQEVENKVSKIMAGINSTMGDYEKELYFHNYLVANCQYNDSALDDEEFTNAYTIYGALVEGNAVCEGYARAMQFLLSRAGVRSYLVTGTSLDSNGLEVNHMWNVVNIDSSWYHLDPTWNDPLTDSSFNTVWHTYFNLTDEEILRDHSFNMQTNCNSTRANYHRKNSLYFTSFNHSDFADRLADEFYTAKRKNLDFIEVRFSNQSDFEEAKNSLFNQQLIYVAVSRVNSKYGTKINTSTIFYSTVDTQFVIGLKF